VIRVLIVAASPLILAGLQSLLADSGVDIVGSAGDLESLAKQLDDVEPDVLLVETSAQARQAFVDEMVGEEIFRGYPVVVLARNMPPGWPSEALRSGVRAVLPSEVSAEQLRAALEAAAAGLVVVHPSEVSAVLPAPAALSSPVRELPEPLTPREREVLQMISAGLGNKEIAGRLSISDHTVKFHVASILGKLGASSRTEAVSIGIRHGLVLL
jgi:two-component system, NarL family, response regulator YdfI